MEREHVERLPLHADSRRLLHSIEEATGIPVEIRADASIRGREGALSVASDPERHLALGTV